ncbi:MAG: DUF1080 domain-containing protein [Isosphaeraceae bacterium]
MRAITVLLCLSGLSVLPATRAGDPPSASRASSDSGWKPLFNGRDLAGWYVFVDGKKNEDPGKVVQVSDGVIHMYKNTADRALPRTPTSRPNASSAITTSGSSTAGGRRSSRQPHLNTKRDAGLIYHFVGEDKIWPRGIECQVQEGTPARHLRGCLGASARPSRGTHTYLPSGEGGVPVTVGSGDEIASITKSRTLEVPGWNKVEVRVRGGSATHLVNGEVNNDWTDLRQPDPKSPGRYIPLTRGRLLLQAEGPR